MAEKKHGQEFNSKGKDTLSILIQTDMVNPVLFTLGSITGGLL